MCVSRVEQERLLENTQQILSELFDKKLCV